MKKKSESSGTIDITEKEIVVNDFHGKSIVELQSIASEIGVEDNNIYRKNELIIKILKTLSEKNGQTFFARGVLEILSEGYGFLRSAAYNYSATQEDIYVAPFIIRRTGLRKGHEVYGTIRLPKEGEKYLALDRVIEVNGIAPEKVKGTKYFEELTPLHPYERFILETEKDEMSGRILDLLIPIGKGQRGLIISPARAGKTILLQKVANSITKNNPEVYIVILLIAERPEEVTDFRRNTKAEIIASTFDELPRKHIEVADTVIERSKRMVEFGKDVVILLDSLTRFCRAHNAEAPHSGKVMTGGIDITALSGPKKFFGSARKIEEGGSLTIIATCLVDTGSRMDEVIYEEFKGTGNMEIHLIRPLAERRIFPAIDITRSGTRREELLMHPDELKRVWLMRKALADVDPLEAVPTLMEKLKKYKNNAEFLMSLKV